MNRKILDYTILLKVLVKISAIGILFGFRITLLPSLIFFSASFVCALGFITFYRSNMLHKSLNEIKAFLFADIAIIIFNMLFVSFSCPIAVSISDTLLTGSVFDIIVNLCLVVYAQKQHKYAVVENDESTIKNIRRSKKAYVRPLQNFEIR